MAPITAGCSILLFHAGDKNSGKVWYAAEMASHVLWRGTMIAVPVPTS